MGLIILVGATFIVYMLLAYSIDPLSDLKQSSSPSRDYQIQSLTIALDLNTPPLQRYFKWLFGVLGFLWGHGTLGSTINKQEVLLELSHVIPNTLTLVLAASVGAIILGVCVGVLTAIRQYSSFDYLITFISFFLYSLPSFLVALCLKEFGAISYNQFLKNPVIPIPSIIIISVVLAFLVSIIVSEGVKKKLIAGGISFVTSVILFSFLSSTKWFAKPGLTIIGVFFLVVVISLASIYISFGFNKQTRVKVAIIVGVMMALYFVANILFQFATSALIILIAVGFIAVGVICGAIVGGVDKASYMKTFGFVGALSFLVVYCDKLLRSFYLYTTNSNIRVPIPTFDSHTSGLIEGVNANYWVFTMDQVTHLVLPTIALLLMSFAGYTRYTRSSMLEVLNMDYIRTARAKGLPERAVIMRHGFKNAIIPLATVIPLDIAGVLGGAIITEKIFGWYGMGSFFSNALTHSDFNAIMGFLLVTASLAVLANIISDIAYAILDPRIRLDS